MLINSLPVLTNNAIANPIFLVQQSNIDKTRVLSEAEIYQQLQGLSDWKTDGKKIYYTRQFNNFVESIDFVNCLVVPAEKAGHHPDINISYNRVTITLTTHDVGGLTFQDFQMANTISELIENWQPGINCQILNS